MGYHSLWNKIKGSHFYFSKQFKFHQPLAGFHYFSVNDSITLNQLFGFLIDNISSFLSFLIFYYFHRQTYQRQISSWLSY